MTRKNIFKPNSFLTLSIFFTIHIQVSAQRSLSVIVDSVAFMAFIKEDTSFSNFVSPANNVTYRKVGTNKLTTLQSFNKYRTLVQDDNKIFSRLQLDSTGIFLNAMETSPDFTSFNLLKGKAVINARETYFNGDWIKLPIRSLKDINSSSSASPQGSLVFNNTTKSLYLSRGDTVVPAYWEFYDSSEIQTPIPTNWAAAYGGSDKLPVIRIRHPKSFGYNSTGNKSMDQDFLIMPYEFGMSFEYNGVEEHHVGVFSVHRGLNYVNEAYENDGNGWGATMFIGDDNDMGGVRIISRFDSLNGGQRKYGEISQEKFGGASHGNLRFRAVNPEDSIIFVQGDRRGNIVKYFKATPGSIDYWNSQNPTGDFTSIGKYNFTSYRENTEGKMVGYFKQQGEQSAIGSFNKENSFYTGLITNPEKLLFGISSKSDSLIQQGFIIDKNNITVAGLQPVNNTSYKFLVTETNTGKMMTVEGTHGENNLLIEKYVPTGTNDPAGKPGDLSNDEDFIYIKTKTGWKRAKLETF